MNRTCAFAVARVALLLSASSFAQSPRHNEANGLEYRLIGPFRGGRSLTATGIPGDPATYYFGAAGGGVWKSVDGANTWKPIFDHEGSASIGSLAVAPSDPNTIYVGTGEGCIRGDAAEGDGVYKSLDGGATWKNIGLKDTRAIGKIIVNPKNPDIVFVAALGHVFGPNPERGVFRTTDGGKTWNKVLYVDDHTGAIDVVFDPNNPNILFAATWQVYRTPWTLSSGGPGSGLYRSADGGSTWKRITEEQGLPKGPYGKVGVAVGADSHRVYALIEAKDNGGLYRSDNGGAKWELVNPEHRLVQRGWYYMHVVADPKDPNKLYVMNVEFLRSIDGGHTFSKIRVPHGDNHGLWIDPTNTGRMVETNDGGATVTLDGGTTWTREDNQPTAQFYHVIADTRFPYYIYGAQQDNTTVAIASRGPHGSIDRPDWYSVGGGESGYIAPDPRDPDIVYADGYQGTITQFDRKTHLTREITVFPELTDGEGAAGLTHRFQWTAPLMLSPHDPNTLYHAGERLFKTTDAGMHWTAISPDLTRNDKSKQIPSGGPVSIDDTGTEYYDTIFALAESPLEKGLLWAGTDDGLVQITRDGGKTWTNVTPKNLPAWSRISQIDASPHDAGTAYVAVDRHQNDDPLPYAYKTTDYGQTWTSITDGIPSGAFLRAVRQDPVRKDLLFAATEKGVFVSYNDGGKWEPLQLNLPMTPIHDLIVKDNDLVVATHGRSFWILDDIAPLRQHTDTVANEDLHLYQPSPAFRLHSGHGFPSPFAGQNPPGGAVIYFSVKKAPKEAKLEILDAQGKLVREYSTARLVPQTQPRDPDDPKPHKELEIKPGLNRFVWNLTYRDLAPRVPGYYLWDYEEGAHGPMALPGNYQVRLTVDGKTATAPLELKPDPRIHASLADLRKQFDILMEIQDQLKRVYTTVNSIASVRAQLAGLKQRIAGTPAESLAAAIDALDEKLKAAETPLINRQVAASEDSLSYPLGLDGQWAYLAAMINDHADAAPTEASIKAFEKLKSETDERLLSWTVLNKQDLPAFDKTAQKDGVGAVFVGAGPK